MPQVWVTYEELGSFLGRPAGDARAHAIAHEFARRHCSDGRTRVKLDPQMGLAFMQAYLRQTAASAAPDHTLPLRDVDEAAMLAAVQAGGAEFLAGEFADLMVSRLRSVAEIARMPMSAAS